MPDEGRWRLLNPLSIRFSQPRIAPHFRDGHLLEEALPQFVEVPLEADFTCPPGADSAEGAPPFDVVLVPPFPPIRVISWLPKLRGPDGEAKRDANGDQMLGKRAWFALDNRRLFAMQSAAAKRWPRRCCVVVRCIEEMPGSTVKELRKFRTTTEGRTIEVGVRAGETSAWSWLHVAPADAHPRRLEPEGLCTEALFDAQHWAPQAMAAIKECAFDEDPTSDDPPATSLAAGMVNGSRRPGKMMPCPEDGWQYVDPQGRLQGPFPLEKMRLWHTHGFFYPDLQMRCDPRDRFLPFAELFPPSDPPFVGRVWRCPPPVAVDPRAAAKGGYPRGAIK